MSLIEEIIRAIKQPDPVKHCEYYKHKGCPHVDGILCLMNECDDLLEYRDELERYKKIKKLSNATRNKVK